MITLKQNDPNLKTILSRNISKSAKGCWEWTEEKSIFGIPNMRVDGAFLEVFKVFWWVEHGYKPQWKFMDRKCKNLICVNPAHYTDATPETLRKKDLVSRVYTTPTFTPEEDADLYRRNTFGETPVELGLKFKVSKYTILSAIRRHCRKEKIETKPPGKYKTRTESPVWTEKEVADLWKRNLFGESVCSLVKETGIKRTTMQRLLRKYSQKIQES